MIRKPASHPALGWGLLPAAVWSRGRRVGTGTSPRGLSGASPLLRPACLPRFTPKAPLPLSGATRPQAAVGPARAGPEEAGLGSCQCCLGEEVGILSMSVKAGVG